MEEKKNVYIVVTSTGLHYIGKTQLKFDDLSKYVGAIVLEDPAFIRMEFLTSSDIPVVQGTELEKVDGPLVMRASLVPPLECGGAHVGGSMYSGTVILNEVSREKTGVGQEDMNVRLGFGIAKQDKIIINNPSLILEPVEGVLEAYSEFCSVDPKMRVSVVHFLGALADNRSSAGMGGSAGEFVDNTTLN
jgi:hypothetical protein